MSYKKIIQFGQSSVNSLPVYNNDPLTLCIGNNASQRFNHGSSSDTYGQNSTPCQAYLSQRCARNWDGICEYAASTSANNEYTTRASTLNAGANDVIGLTPGEILLRNTAHERFRTAMLGCQMKSEPFNPQDPNSPYISFYVGRNCVPVYEVNPATIDSDIVMNKILDNPRIAIQMLRNIRNTMARKGTLKDLVGTRIGSFFHVPLSGQNKKKTSGSGKETYKLPSLAPTIHHNSPYIIPTRAGLTDSRLVKWWPTEYIDYWPNEYDGAWRGTRGVRY